MAHTLADRNAPAQETTETPSWVVELNIAGYRFLRRAAKRRHLLGLPALRPSGVA